MSKAGVHNSNLRAGQKYLFALLKGPKLYVFTILKGASNKQQGERAKNFTVRAKLKASTGHILRLKQLKIKFLFFFVFPFSFHYLQKKWSN